MTNDKHLVINDAKKYEYLVRAIEKMILRIKLINAYDDHYVSHNMKHQEIKLVIQEMEEALTNLR